MGVSTAGTSMYEQLRELVRAVERGEFQLLNLSITQNESRRALQRGIGDDYDRQYSIGTSATIHVDIEVAPGKIGIVGERGSVGAPGGRGGGNSGGNSSAVFVSGGGGGSGGAGVSASEWQDYTSRRDVEEPRDRVRYATAPAPQPPNPWMPENWNLTAQGAFITKYGVEQAAEAARRADSRVGETKPGTPCAEITRTTNEYPRKVQITPTETFIQRLSAQLASMRDVAVVQITQRGYDLLRVGGVLSGDMSPVRVCGVNVDILGADSKKAPWPTETEREVARTDITTDAEVVRSLKNGAREIDFD